MMVSTSKQSQAPPSVAAPGSIDTGTEFEESAGGPVGTFDFESMARIIDGVAGYDPARLSTLLAILWHSRFKAEARDIMHAAVTCRDLLAGPGSICADALRTLADLEKLARAGPWRSLVSVVGHQDPRACALLNACDHAIAHKRQAKQVIYKAIRARLEDAAGLERSARGKEIQILTGLRQARCPKIWEIYETWLAKE